MAQSQEHLEKRRAALREYNNSLTPAERKLGPHTAEHRERIRQSCLRYHRNKKSQ